MPKKQPDPLPLSGKVAIVTGASRGVGKRSGLRVIYYWDKPAEVLYMLWVYRKRRQEDLTPRQSKLLSKLVKEYLA